MQISQILKWGLLALVLGACVTEDDLEADEIEDRSDGPCDDAVIEDYLERALDATMIEEAEPELPDACTTRGLPTVKCGAGYSDLGLFAHAIKKALDGVGNPPDQYKCCWYRPGGFLKDCRHVKI